MTTRVGSFVGGHFHPRLVTALVTIAMIGTWRGRTFLDDDSGFDDVADFVPADTTARDSLPGSAAAAAVTPSRGTAHPAAA
jgi:hypothetical protein